MSQTEDPERELLRSNVLASQPLKMEDPAICLGPQRHIHKAAGWILCYPEDAFFLVTGTQGSNGMLRRTGGEKT